MKYLLALITALALSAPVSAATITLRSALHEYEIEIGTVYGAYETVKDDLAAQLWWQDSSLKSVLSASDAGRALGSELGYLNTIPSSSGNYLMQGGPIFAFRVSANMTHVAGYFVTPAGQAWYTVDKTDQHHYAVALSVTKSNLGEVPLPAGGLLLMSGLGALLLRGRFKGAA